jgi:hypothetical protein
MGLCAASFSILLCSPSTRARGLAVQGRAAPAGRRCGGGRRGRAARGRLAPLDVAEGPGESDPLSYASTGLLKLLSPLRIDASRLASSFGDLAADGGSGGEDDPFFFPDHHHQQLPPDEG